MKNNPLQMLGLPRNDPQEKISIYRKAIELDPTFNPLKQGKELMNWVGAYRQKTPPQISPTAMSTQASAQKPLNISQPKKMPLQSQVLGAKTQAPQPTGIGDVLKNIVGAPFKAAGDIQKQGKAFPEFLSQILNPPKQENILPTADQRRQRAFDPNVLVEQTNKAGFVKPKEKPVKIFDIPEDLKGTGLRKIDEGPYGETAFPVYAVTSRDQLGNPTEWERDPETGGIKVEWVAGEVFEDEFGNKYKRPLEKTKPEDYVLKPGPLDVQNNIYLGVVNDFRIKEFEKNESKREQVLNIVKQSTPLYENDKFAIYSIPTTIQPRSKEELAELENAKRAAFNLPPQGINEMPEEVFGEAQNQSRKVKVWAKRDKLATDPEKEWYVDIYALGDIDPIDFSHSSDIFSNLYQDLFRTERKQIIPKRTKFVQRLPSKDDSFRLLDQGALSLQLDDLIRAHVKIENSLPYELKQKYNFPEKKDVKTYLGRDGGMILTNTENPDEPIFISINRDIVEKYYRNFETKATPQTKAPPTESVNQFNPIDQFKALVKVIKGERPTVFRDIVENEMYKRTVRETRPAIVQVLGPQTETVPELQLDESGNFVMGTKTRQNAGSGWFIDNQHIVTNEHVLSGALKDPYQERFEFDKNELPKIKLHDGRVVSVKSFFRSAHEDVAILTLEKPVNITPLKLGQVKKEKTFNIAPGSSDPYSIKAVGETQKYGEYISPLADLFGDRLTSGKPGTAPYTIQPTIGGKSGSPVMDMEGNLVGMLSRYGPDEWTASALGMPPELIQKIYDEYMAMEKSKASGPDHVSDYLKEGTFKPIQSGKMANIFETLLSLPAKSAQLGQQVGKSIFQPAINFGQFVGEAGAQATRYATDPTFRKAIQRPLSTAQPKRLPLQSRVLGAKTQTPQQTDIGSVLKNIIGAPFKASRDIQKQGQALPEFLSQILNPPKQENILPTTEQRRARAKIDTEKILKEGRISREQEQEKLTQLGLTKPQEFELPEDLKGTGLKKISEGPYGQAASYVVDPEAILSRDEFGNPNYARDPVTGITPGEYVAGELFEDPFGNRYQRPLEKTKPEDYKLSATSTKDSPQSLNFRTVMNYSRNNYKKFQEIQKAIIAQAKQDQPIFENDKFSLYAVKYRPEILTKEEIAGIENVRRAAFNLPPQSADQMPDEIFSKAGQKPREKVIYVNKNKTIQPGDEFAGPTPYDPTGQWYVDSTEFGNERPFIRHSSDLFNGLYQDLVSDDRKRYGPEYSSGPYKLIPLDNITIQMSDLLSAEKDIRQSMPYELRQKYGIPDAPEIKYQVMKDGGIFLRDEEDPESLLFISIDREIMKKYFSDPNKEINLKPTPKEKPTRQENQFNPLDQIRALQKIVSGERPSVFDQIAENERYLKLKEKVKPSVVTVTVAEDRLEKKSVPELQLDEQGNFIMGEQSLSGRGGSGWFIDNQHVVTNAHVLNSILGDPGGFEHQFSKEQFPLIELSNGKKVKIKSFFRSANDDVAILTLEKPVSGITPLKTRQISEREQTFNIAPGSADPYSIKSTGQTQSIGDFYSPLAPLFGSNITTKPGSISPRTEGPVIGGKSGSPIMDMDGNVVGMTTQSGGINYVSAGMPAALIQKIYDDYMARGGGL